MIDRLISKNLATDFGSGKVIVVIGARQVGKTTLVNHLAKDYRRVYALNCDNYDDRAVLENRTSSELQHLLRGYDLVFIDEAQRVAGIGLTIKMIADLHQPTHVIVSGSSSLELADGIKEAATGRHIDYELFALSTAEMVAASSQRDERRLLSQRLIYGRYPEVVTYPANARRTLMSLADDYLYKDLLSYRGVKRPELLRKLLQALALQLGSEVSYNELAQLIGADKSTVESYIGLLEKCYVVFRLDSFSRNLRNEIKTGKKVYFYDNGIRNAILSNFALPEQRSDMGALWENFLVSERRKFHSYNQTFTRMYFWRTQTQSEIDLVEECDGRLAAFEFKYNPKRAAKLPAPFATAYPEAQFSVITPDNYMPFVGCPD